MVVKYSDLDTMQMKFEPLLCHLTSCVPSNKFIHPLEDSTPFSVKWRKQFLPRRSIMRMKWYEVGKAPLIGFDFVNIKYF